MMNMLRGVTIMLRRRVNRKHAMGKKYDRSEEEGGWGYCMRSDNMKMATGAKIAGYRRCRILKSAIIPEKSIRVATQMLCFSAFPNPSPMEVQVHFEIGAATEVAIAGTIGELRAFRPYPS